MYHAKTQRHKEHVRRVKRTIDTHRCVSLALLLIGPSLLLGCGRGSQIQRTIVAGKVLYQGQPIADGSILFVPTKGTGGPQAGAQITDGAYRVTAGGGVPVGTHRVEIEAYRFVPSSRPRPTTPEERMGKQQYLPEQYNNKSTLEATIDGTGEQTRDFDLK
jgi:hypothetical protein